MTRRGEEGHLTARDGFRGTDAADEALSAARTETEAQGRARRLAKDALQFEDSRNSLVQKVP